MHTDLVTRLRAAGSVFAEDEAALLIRAAADDAHLERMTQRRIRGDALEHVVGWTDFCGLRIPLDAGVFVPRRRTEVLARATLDRVRDGDLVVELCCGAAAIGRFLIEHRRIELHAADVVPAAVANARRTLESRATVHEGDLFDALPEALRGRIDVVVANVPYVPTAEIEHLPRDFRDNEPRVALDGGADGLDVLRRLVGVAPAWLRPGASVLVESSLDQAAAAAAVLQDAGFAPRIDIDDELEVAVVSGTLG